MEGIAIFDHELSQGGLAAVARGGVVLKKHFGAVCSVDCKDNLELITEADRTAEAEIVETLRRHFPHHGILSEERPEIAPGAEYRWVLDPLDGTTNFAHGYPFFCVSLALQHQGVTIWGAVYDPLREELFQAARGQGSLLNDSPIRVSAAAHLGEAMLCTGFPYDVHDSPENNLDHFAGFLRTARAVRRDGAAALDLCYVAAGRFDGFWELKLRPWDFAAGCLIVSEAGGRVTRFDGAAVRLDHGDVVASNGGLHAQMLAVLADAK